MTARPSVSSGRTGRPPVTSQAEILAAAQRLIERDGWEKLTIRRLASEAGTAPTTIYHHVRDKEQLLTQLLNHSAEATARPVLPDDPRQRIVVAATLMHDTLAASPWITQVLTADDLLSEAALWMVEAIVGGAVTAGCAPDHAVTVYRSIWYYTAGEILIRTAAARRRTDDRPTQRDEVFTNLDADELPHLAALGERWAELTARDTYRVGLEALLVGLLP